MDSIKDILNNSNRFSSVSWKEHYVYTLIGNLELIKVVHDNYKHIDQLDKLTNLFSEYKSEYEDEIHPDAKVFYKLCYSICKLTKDSHYHLLSGIETQYHIDEAIEIVRTYYKHIQIAVESEQASIED